MNFNFFKKSENTTPSIEVATNDMELEATQEEEISPERIEALKELDNQILEIASLKESDLVEEISDPEKRESLGGKLTTLSKITDILKEYAPAIATTAVALGAVVFAITNMETDTANSAVMSAEKMGQMISSSVAAVAGVISGLLYTVPGFNKEQAALKAKQAE